MLYNNIMTVDLEEWYNGNYLSVKGYFTKKSTVNENTELLLELFSKYNIKSTFFVLGTVAKNNPELLKKIHSLGHDISCHSYSHKLVYTMSKEEFKEDTRKSKEIIEDIIGDRILGYRAPSWSITKKSLWAYEILKELGFSYSSSVFPVNNYLYGIDDFSRKIINVSDYSKELKGIDFFEIPSTTFKFMKKNIPFSGGFYIRSLPNFFIKKFIKSVNKQKLPVIFYIHPWELDKYPQKFSNISKKEDFIRTFNVKNNYEKFENIIEFVKNDSGLISIEKYYQF